MLKDTSVKTAPAKAAPAKPAEAKPAQVKSAAAKPAQARSAGAKAGAAKVADRATKGTAARVVATAAVHDPAPRAMDDLERLIQQRAYQLWESEGRPQGRDQDHWQLAEGEITGRAANGRA